MFYFMNYQFTPYNESDRLGLVQEQKSQVEEDKT